ncbi:nucleotidyltransferase family protein [Micromonospora sp. NPDC050417]|uniref:nucleotidyltransferase family protein n=1 Tax=Micromonospora sp. NPDC050417 TaxID=3364280 RepID=UPI0037A8F2F0
MFDRLHRLLLAELNAAGRIDWSRAIVDVPLGLPAQRLAAVRRRLQAERPPVGMAQPAAGVPFAVRKDPSLIERVYHDAGKRRMHDLDLLIRRSDGTEAREALAGLGYAEGKLSLDGTRIEPYSRRTQMHWRLHVSSALPQIRFSGRADITVYTVDLCFSPFQPSWPTQLDT